MNPRHHTALIAFICFVFLAAVLSLPAHSSNTPLPSPPVAHDDGPLTVHGPSARIDPDMFSNDEGEPPFSLNVIGDIPSHGNLTFGDGTQVFYNVSNYTGPDSFTYSVHDVNGNSNFATVSLNVVNQAPIAVNDLYVIRGSQQLLPGVISNDFDPDAQDYVLFDVVIDQPTHGTLGLGGNGTDIISYNPNPNYFGVDSFTYKITDNLGMRSAVATVTLFVIGNCESCGVVLCNVSIGSPVNVTTGNMYLNQRDYFLPGTGPALNVTRTYNSDSQAIGLFGRGWSTAYDESITSYDNNLARLNLGDGRAVYFGRALGSSGSYLPLEGDFHGELIQNLGGYKVIMKDGSINEFNVDGKLISITDRNSNATTLTYGSNHRLASVTDPFGHVLNFDIDSNGRVASLSDDFGDIASYEYGTGGVLSSVTYPDNSGFDFAYDGANRLTSATDFMGNVVESHTYDSQGRALTSAKDGGIEQYSLDYVSSTETDVTDALGRITKYTFDNSKGPNLVTQVQGLCSCPGGSGSQTQTWTYDNQLNVTSRTDGLNHTTSYTYDSSGNQLTQTDATGTVTFTYNAFGEILTRTDQMSGVTTNTYDSHGNLLTTTDPLSHASSWTYDSRGQVTTMTDARSKVTTFTWDEGRPIEVTDALSHHKRFTYDSRARLTNVLNALEESTSFEYDLAGRLSKITFPDENFTTATYDQAGRREIITDARGHNTHFGYDAAYRLTSVTDALDQTTSVTYDAMSNQTSVTDPLGNVTTYEYDEFNRPRKLIYPAAIPAATPLQQTIEYDAAGNVKKTIDTAGRNTTYVYDNANRLTSITDPASQVTQFEYNARSQTTAMVDALNQRYTFTYDALNRNLQRARGALSVNFVYDAVGNRTARTDHNGDTTNYAYDDLNQLTTVTYPDSTSVTFSYDDLSRITSATNQTGTVTYAYDNRGRVSSTTGVFGQSLSYGYDEKGNRTALSIGGNAYASYAYDDIDRLTDLSDPSAVISHYSYDAKSRLTGRSLVNGTRSNYSYDGMSRLTNLNVRGFADSEFVYNTANQIAQQTESEGGWAGNFSYDSLNRLTGWTQTVPDPNEVTSEEVPPGLPNGHRVHETYSYDGVGNRTAASGIPTTSYTYDPFNRLASTNGSAYTYDNNGNLLSKDEDEDLTTYTWDFENRLTQVTTPGGLTVNYEYDALGRRVRRSTSSGASLKFVYDGQEVVQDLDNSGDVVTSYLNGPGPDDKVRQSDAAYGNLYFTTDRVGSTVFLTDDSGNKVEAIGYDSFGASVGVHATRYVYTGREFDADTNLYYYRARWYDPSIGRFLSEDPMAFVDGVNMYSYVGNNPIAFRDPTGLSNLDSDNINYPSGFSWPDYYRQREEERLAREKDRKVKLVQQCICQEQAIKEKDVANFRKLSEESQYDWLRDYNAKRFGNLAQASFNLVSIDGGPAAIFVVNYYFSEIVPPVLDPVVHQLTNNQTVNDMRIGYQKDDNQRIINCFIKHGLEYDPYVLPSNLRYLP